MIVVAYVLFVVALTFLGTVRWVRIGPDEPHTGPPRSPRATPGAPQGSDGARDLPEPQKPAHAHTRPHWARQTQEQP